MLQVICKTVLLNPFRRKSSLLLRSTKIPSLHLCSKSNMTTETFDGESYRLEIDRDHMKVYMPSPIDTVSSSSPPLMKASKRGHGGEESAKVNNEDSKRNEYVIPESTRQYERQLRKIQAAKRASTPLSASQLDIVHNDQHVVVVNKPSGVLTVPGVNDNPNLLSLVYDTIKDECKVEKIEHMIVHRLDMDTSGIVIFAKTKDVMSKLQASFRRDVKTSGHIEKVYEALLCGHLDPRIQSGIIDLPLQRDHRYPPFMRVATPTSEREAKEVVKGLNHAGWKKIVKKAPKQSQTLLRVMKREYIKAGQTNEEDIPVTRVQLTPVTGRTHQLRVHCAAIGHPILADPTYGILGEASQNGGFEDKVMDNIMPTRASTALQMKLDQWAKNTGQVMCLHARKLKLDHPQSGQEMAFERDPLF